MPTRDIDAPYALRILGEAEDAGPLFESLA